MPDIEVIVSDRDSTCSQCGKNLAVGAQIVENNGAGRCLSCACLDHLIWLPAGDGTLTRRAKKYSTPTAVVQKWSKSRKRYERQGLLVTAAALKRAKQECLNDEGARRLRRECADQKFVRRFADRVRELFPCCPPGRETVIAERACLKSSGRVGRSAAAKRLDEKAVRSAVIAHVRHTETQYDTLIKGWDKETAREEVRAEVEAVLVKWEGREKG